MTSQPQKTHVLSTSAITIAGDYYDPRQNIWSFSDGTRTYNFYFNKISKHVSQSFIISIKACFAYMLEIHKYATVIAKYHAIINFFEVTACHSIIIDRIEPHHILNYFSADNPDLYKINTKLFFKYYDRFSLPGISENASRALDHIKTPTIKSHIALKTCDPQKGPYTELEFNNLSDAIDFAYEQGRITDKEYLIALLFNLFGLRPRQVAWLKIKDFQVQCDENHTLKYSLHIPRDKQRHVEPRVEFTKRSLVTDLGELFDDWIAHVKIKYYEIFNDTSYDISLLPLFPNWKNTSCTELKYHSSVQKITSTIYKLGRMLTIKSRTGEQLHLNPRRSRHHLGTKLAIAGCSANVIACALDHSSIQSSRHYIQIGEAAIQAIDNGVAQYHSPLVRAFKGEIFKKTNLLGTINTYEPIESIDGEHTIGLCVKPGGCGVYLSDSKDPETFLARIPFSCYRCLNFHAFDDLAAHKEHLEILRSERDLHVRAFTKGSPASQPIMALAYDPIIFAIVQVINKIEANDVSIFEPEEDIIDSW